MVRLQQQTGNHGSVGKESACNAGDTGDASSVPASGRSPGGGHGNPTLVFWSGEAPMGKIPWTQEPGRLQTTAQRVAKNRTGLSGLSTIMQLQ